MEISSYYRVTNPYASRAKAARATESGSSDSGTATQTAAITTPDTRTRPDIAHISSRDFEAYARKLLDDGLINQNEFTILCPPALPFFGSYDSPEFAKFAASPRDYPFDHLKMLEYNLQTAQTEPHRKFMRDLLAKVKQAFPPNPVDVVV